MTSLQAELRRLTAAMGAPIAVAMLAAAAGSPASAAEQVYQAASQPPPPLPPSFATPPPTPTSAPQSEAPGSAPPAAGPQAAGPVAPAPAGEAPGPHRPAGHVIGEAPVTPSIVQPTPVAIDVAPAASPPVRVGLPLAPEPVDSRPAAGSAAPWWLVFPGLLMLAAPLGGWAAVRRRHPVR